MLIFQAIRNGQRDEAVRWLKCVPSELLNETVDKVTCTQWNGKYTALQLAAEHNQLEIARLLLDAGAGKYFKPACLGEYCSIRGVLHKYIGGDANHMTFVCMLPGLA